MNKKIQRIMDQLNGLEKRKLKKIFKKKFWTELEKK
jgi:hypothetical protein